MNLSHHGQTRANQRGFPRPLLDLIAMHGNWQGGDRQSLDRRGLTAYLAELDAARGDVIRLLDKGGGTTVFGEDDVLVTVFSPRSFHRRKRRFREYELS